LGGQYQGFIGFSFKYRWSIGSATKKQGFIEYEDKPRIFSGGSDKPLVLGQKSDEPPVFGRKSHKSTPFFFWVDKPLECGPALMARGFFIALCLAAARPKLCFTKTKWVQ